MRLHIFNVGHGSCAYLIADNCNVALFDCGHDDEVGFRPSVYLPARDCTGIEHLVVSHYDEDHVSDLANLRAKLPVNVLHRNRTVGAEEIRAIKRRDQATVGPGLESLFGMIGTYTAGAVNSPELAGVELVTFLNLYPAFQDTNNLSLVSFVHYGHVSIVLPGDIEQAGWTALLANEAFRANLERVRIFVASHHGRANGYLPEVFRYCTPDVVVISDTVVQHDTQENCYAQHAKGIPWGGGRTTRYVLTTRRDGHITIEPHALGYRITTQQGLP